MQLLKITYELCFVIYLFKTERFGLIYNENAHFWSCRSLLICMQISYNFINVILCWYTFRFFFLPQNQSGIKQIMDLQGVAKHVSFK